MLKWVGVEHCDHSAPGGIIFQCPIMPLAAKMFYCSIWPQAAKMFYCTIWPWRHNPINMLPLWGHFYTIHLGINITAKHCETLRLNSAYTASKTTARTPPLETPITYFPAIPSPFRLMLFAPFHLIPLYQTDF